MKERVAVDLFCGAGGTSTGLLRAAEAAGVSVDLLAINHWQIAVQTHTANHPAARHRCEDIEAVKPREAVPSGRVNLLVASPECIHHSNARGGRPMNDQSRASAWHVLRWAEALYIDSILIENVPEFMSWGPLGANGRPLKGMKGKLFEQFLRSLRNLGYTVDHRILNAADYGDATTRQRLFVQARRGGKRITWPEPTHGRNRPTMTASLFPELKTERWRPAREIIDWSIRGRSIYGRKRPLADNTLRRIFAGLHKFSGLPFLLGQQSGATPRRLDEPVPTIAGAGAISLIEPYLVVLRNNCDARSLDDPCPALVAGANHIGLAQPYLVNMKGRSNAASVDDPAPTITAHARHLGLVSACLTPVNHGPDARCHSVEAPFPTITAFDALGLTEGWIVPFYGERPGQEPRCCSVEDPLDTVSCAGRYGLARPFVVKFNGTGGALSLDDPLDTISTRDRFGLVHPELVRSGEFRGPVVGWLDILFRMLQPHELAAAMSFPRTYTFAGNREQQVRQIGNAVPCRLAEALCRGLLQ